MTKQARAFAVLGCAAFATASVWAVGATHYAEGVATVPENSGYGKVYVGMTAQDAGEIDAPTSTDAYVNTQAKKTSGNEENKTFDFYYYVQPQPGCTFLGWSESATATEGELGTANPLKIAVPTSSDGTETKQVYPIFSVPETQTATFVGESDSWFVPANWDVGAAPQSPIYLPVVPSGKSVVYDAVSGGAELPSLNFTELRLGGGEGEGAATVELAAGGLNLKKLRLGVAAGSVGVLRQTGGTLAFFGDDEFIVGEAAGAEDWSEYELVDGTMTGANTLAGLTVGRAGKGRFTMTGGTFTQTGPITVARQTGSAGEVVVAGGTLRLENHLLLGAGGSAVLRGEGRLIVDQVKPYDADVAGTFTLDGGTLVYRAKGTENETEENFVAGLAGFYLGANGGTIDTAGAEVKIPVLLRKDPALGDASAGTFVKTGAGRLWLAKGSALKGAVIVAAGTLVVDPGDVDLSHVRIEKGATLAFGTTTGTLVFDTTNGSMDCSNVELLGADKIVKEGEGTLYLASANTRELEINGGTVDFGVGYRFYRVNCESLVTWLGYTGGWSMAEFALFCGEEKLPVESWNLFWDAEAMIEGLTHREGCTPDKLFDGDYETWMEDKRMSSEGSNFAANYKNIEAAWFGVDFGKRTVVTSYTWYRSPTSAYFSTAAGDMYDANDPTHLRVYGSNDGATWVELANNTFSPDGAGPAEARSSAEHPMPGGSATVLEVEPGAIGWEKLTMKAETRLVVSGGDLHAAEVVSEAGAKIVFDENAALVLDRQEPGVLSGVYNSNLRVATGTTETRAASVFDGETRVEVDAEAKLVVAEAATQTIPALVYDWTRGGGTIDGFHPAAHGELALVNVPENAALCGLLPWELTNVVDAQNLATWRLTVNGTASGLRVMFKNGKIAIVESGLTLLFR